MRALTEKGWIDVHVGQVFAGIGFLKVEVSFEDVIEERFNEWFQENIANRLYPKDVKGQPDHVRMTDTPCPNCGCKGFHACMGAFPKPMTEAERQAMKAALEKVASEMKKEVKPDVR